MADAQYTFDTQDNSYFGGVDLRVTDGTDHTIIVNVKGNDWAVDVKDDMIFRQWPADVQKASEQIGEERTEHIYQQVQREFWDWANDAAQRYGFGGVTQEGHSGGWACADGSAQRFPEIVEPDSAEAREARDAFLAFAFEVERSIEDDWRPQFFEQVKAKAAEPVKLFRLYIGDDVEPMPVNDPRSWDDGMDRRELEQRLSSLAADADGRVTVKIESYELTRATVAAAAELAKVDWHGPSEELMGGVPASTVIEHVRETTDDEDEIASALDILGELEVAA